MDWDELTAEERALIEDFRSGRLQVSISEEEPTDISDWDFETLAEEDEE